MSRRARHFKLEKDFCVSVHWKAVEAFGYMRFHNMLVVLILIRTWTVEGTKNETCFTIPVSFTICLCTSPDSDGFQDMFGTGHSK